MDLFFHPRTPQSASRKTITLAQHYE